MTHGHDNKISGELCDHKDSYVLPQLSTDTSHNDEPTVMSCLSVQMEEAEEKMFLAVQCSFL